MAQVTDVVCGMTVDTATAKHKTEYKGQTYYFCSPGCKTVFEREPAKYAPAKQQPDEHGRPAA